MGGTDAYTLSEEIRIGSAWLKQYRRQAPITYDPILNEYIEQLTDRLLKHSDVQYPSISLVVAKNRTLNAFAVPGGIVGIHTGLLEHARTEQQLASVIAHELAHLRQRHYARGRAKQKQQSLTTMAALLASLVLIASSDSDAGEAALTATQAYAIDQQLRFSRAFEREADRIGMNILVKANMSPHATTDMFEEMERVSRYSSQAPEFLLTHPLTTNRMVDAINLARQYPRTNAPDNIDYQLVRARALLSTQTTPQQAIQRFKNELTGFSSSIETSRYGLALSLIDNKEFQTAKVELEKLLAKHPDNLILQMTLSDTLAGTGQAQEAIALIEKLINQHSDYYPLKLQLSHLHNAQKNYAGSTKILSELSSLRPQDPGVWYQLAETAGLANQISLLHKARAEYFILHANFSNAEQQLKSLLEREKDSNSTLYTEAKNRLIELEQIKTSSKI